MMNRSICSPFRGSLPHSVGAGLAILTILVVLPSLGLTGREAHAPEQSPKTAEQVFKNIQALKGLPAAQVAPIMSYMQNVLGVTCPFCHVNDTEYEKDGRKAKVPFLARRLRPEYAYKDVYAEVVHNIPIDNSKFVKPAEALK